MKKPRVVKCSRCNNEFAWWRVNLTEKGLQCPYCKDHTIEEID